jgi:hypothetical protein
LLRAVGRVSATKKLNFTLRKNSRAFLVNN